MARQYHVTLDDDLSDFVERRRKVGNGVEGVFAEALVRYRRSLEQEEFELLLERGYAESAAEDLELLEEFCELDREALLLLDEESRGEG